MPWKPDDAHKYNHGAESKRVKALWAGVANETLARTGDEGRAVRAANAAIKGRPSKSLESQS